MIFVKKVTTLSVPIHFKIFLLNTDFKTICHPINKKIIAILKNCGSSLILRSMSLQNLTL